MNIILAIKPDYAAAILAGTKTVELRSHLPRRLRPGDTIFLVSRGRIWGHCTFAGATPAPAAGFCRDQWMESIATPAAVPVAAARHYLGPHGGYAWHVRYPVTYAPGGVKYTGKTIQCVKYTTAEPHITHPKLANYLLYLQSHKQ